MGTFHNRKMMSVDNKKTCSKSIKNFFAKKTFRNEFQKTEFSKLKNSHLNA